MERKHEVVNMAPVSIKTQAVFENLDTKDELVIDVVGFAVIKFTDITPSVTAIKPIGYIEYSNEFILDTFMEFGDDNENSSFRLVRMITE